MLSFWSVSSCGIWLWGIVRGCFGNGLRDTTERSCASSTMFCSTLRRTSVGPSKSVQFMVSQAICVKRCSLFRTVRHVCHHVWVA